MKNFILSAALISSALADPRQPEFYLREEIPMPEGEVLELGGIAIMPGKKVAVSSRRGDIWVCEGAYGKDLSKVTWTLYARGLHEPLGMFYRDGSLFVTQRPEITKLTDTDGDGRADNFETVTHHWGIDGDYHEYNFGSNPDKNGDIWVVHCLTGSGGASQKSPWRGWCYRYNLDGTATPTCPGIRSPGGIGFNQAGDAFYTDNQGLWNGSSSLKWLKPGGFMGNPTGNKYVDLVDGMEKPPNPKSDSRMVIEHDKDKRIIPPAIILPHGKVGQSPTAVIYDNTKGKFGPFNGQVLVGEQTHSQIQRVYLEKVKGLYQGAVWKYLEDFRSGIVPARMGDDATLFVGGTNRGWGGRGLVRRRLVRRRLVRRHSRCMKCMSRKMVSSSPSLSRSIRRVPQIPNLTRPPLGPIFIKRAMVAPRSIRPLLLWKRPPFPPMENRFTLKSPVVSVVTFTTSILRR